ncbi:MAG: hypothetical protein GY846_27120 [Deltaproteobacteria bacterium]|nr:hypothetical protein [Deltaproteobacteria bacterium]
MKLWALQVFGFFGLWFLMVGNCVAVDLEALDRVSVNMDRTAVRSLLGPPDAEIELSIGLEADVYDLEGLAPLIGKGCVYSKEDRLVGQAFVFEGSVKNVTAERLKMNGFSLVEENPGPILLAGKDDDSGHPIMVSVSENGGLTTVVTFEKNFYQKAGEKNKDR